MLSATTLATRIHSLAGATVRLSTKMYSLPPASGRMAIPAAHALAVARDLVAGLKIADAPASWTEVVEESLSYPYANAVNGALLRYDWTDLLN